MILKRIVFLAIAAAWIINDLNAQDPHFSQFYANPVYLNPAMVGTADGNRIVLNHRQQWAKPISYTTSAVSIDGSLNSIKSGWGVQVLNDNQINGKLVQTRISAVAAHRVEISKDKYLGMGLNIGVYRKRVDWSDLTFEDQLDPKYGLVNPTNERFGKDNIANATASVGLVYISETIIAGIAANHLNRPREQFTVTSNERLSIKYTAHIGGIFDIDIPGQNQFFSPNIIMEKQGPFTYFNFGMYYGIEAVSVGIYYRSNDAIIGLLGLNYGDFKIGYSYDYTISKVAAGNNNSHELSIAYLFEFSKIHNRKGRYKGKCPKFYKYLL
jgi:type IX secretion system PorP/SprF family membrane protein